MYHSDVFQRIREKTSEMSKAQQKIARYLIQHPDTSPFLTAAKLAKKAEVGEATVVRFANFLGYRGYPELQSHLQEAIKRQLSTVERLEQYLDEYDGEEKIVYEVLNNDIENLQNTIQQLDPSQFREAVKAIVEAKNIYIIAYRSAVALGTFMEFYLDLILQNTELVRQADGISEHLLGITDRDLVIGIGFARYTKRTVEVMKYSKEKGAKTMAITDNLMSPLIPHSDIVLTASSHITSIIDSFSAPLSIINGLITAVTQKEQSKVKKRLKELEDLWGTFDVFYKAK
ncbi:MurR/RpiR family transcriptional regulator [Microaerobacter geothermalis]|uniref:MurR/RpiR family transcriptional regulator n=1 Tax=Microaerobacter geothermalis TaxID=674972 RepID=UPI001F32DC30|nr:MurR/RpiR family transcriptional regulator [Microaerobacter geothermalis]MCF6092381.1 MurR/RpiR family transcriptional regulator [Microaerobacter geothermalis]